MQKSLHNTALLVFSRTPSEEAAVKTFDKGISQKGNTAIAGKLIQHTLATARQSQIPLFTAFSSQQQGDHLGERLANAIESLFQQGYASVIAIGNDSPDICPELLRQAEQRLQQQELVLGPAQDGGLYLIGIRQSAYSRQQFIDLPWESDQLQKHWQQFADTHLSTPLCWLKVCADIDNSWDFYRFLQSRPKADALKQALTSIINAVKTPITSQLAPWQSITLHRSNSLRAPPQR